MGVGVVGGAAKGNVMLISPRASVRPPVIRSARVTARSRSLDSALVVAFAASLVAMLVTQWLPLVFVAGVVGTCALLAELRDINRG